MKNILLFGAGKSATVLINYLLQNAATEGWHVIVADANLQLVKEKVGNSSYATALSFDIENEVERKNAVATADIVISLLPPHLHLLVAKECINCKKDLLTASYVDDQLKMLEKEIAGNGLLFLCEAGLDPGIDHMSATKLLDEIKTSGGKVTSFISHCGGLVADESDDNPWHYKISWNPKNVVIAGKKGAIFKQDGEIKELDYEQLFSENRYVTIPGYHQMSWYPNRDSLHYASLYHLENCPTFIRTTLRHPDFINGWKNIVFLKLTDEKKVYQTNGKSGMQFFNEHLERHQLKEWMEQKLFTKMNDTQKVPVMLDQLVALEENDKSRSQAGVYKNIDTDGVKTEAPSAAENKIQQENLMIKQLLFLGLNGAEIINKGLCSAADVLQAALEKKLSLSDTDKDLVVMMHEIEYEKEGRKFRKLSTLLVKGENNRETAMAKTVGLPLGICAKLVLNGVIKSKGLQIPVLKEIYEPVLTELKEHQIIFNEEKMELP